MLRLKRPARIAVAVAFAAISLTGCANNGVLKGEGGHKTHTIRMTVSSNIFAAALSYQVGHGKSIEVSTGVGCTAPGGSPTATSSSTTHSCPGLQNQFRFASKILSVRSGTHVSMTGGAPVTSAGAAVAANGSGPLPSTDTFTCTIAVDGAARVTKVAIVPLGAPVPTCNAAGYVGDRPFQLSRLLEFIALGVSLLVVVVGIAAQLVPARRRA